jgi:O-antigen ligase
MLKPTSRFIKVFEKTLIWGVVAIILTIPLYMKFPLFWVRGSFVSIRLEDLLILFVYILWFIYLVLTASVKKFFADRINRTILLFFIVALLSVFSAGFLTQTADLKLALFHLGRRVELIMLMPLVISVTKDKRQIKVYLFVFFISLILVNIYAFGQKYFHFPVVSTINSELSGGSVYSLNPGDRVNSTFAGHYDLAVYLMMAVTVLTSVFFYFFDKVKKGFRNAIYSVYIAFAAVVSFVVLVMTAARLSFLAVVAGVFLSLILVGKKKYLLVFAALLLVLALYPSQLRDRFYQTVRVNILQTFGTYQTLTEEQELRSKLNIPTLPQKKDEEVLFFEGAPDVTPGEPTDPTSIGIYRSLNIRTQVEWPRAIRAFIKNPLLGIGYSSIGLATDNDVLRSLGEVGILGTWAFVLVLYAVGKEILTNYKKLTGFSKYFTSGIIAMMAAFILNSLLIDVFEASKVASIFWLLIGINITLINLDKNAK